MISPLFELFEIIADELSSAESMVITSQDIKERDKESSLLNDLTLQMKAVNGKEAIDSAVKSLRTHFEGKGAKLPFEYDPVTGRFTRTDLDFLEFVTAMSAIRSTGKESRNFECRVAKRLGCRATGSIHRLGHPRDKRKKRADFNKYLRSLGFRREVALGKEKDGGLDILWLLPVGTIPHRPIVSLQCKNGEFNISAADISVGAGSRSLSQHGWLQVAVHVPCVLFNDYMYPEMLPGKAMNFVPLGLSDLASMKTCVSVELA